MQRMGRTIPGWFAVALAIPSAAIAQTTVTGAEMYRAWCQQCHGADGSGQVPARPVPTVPLDFTDCRMATPETDADWELAIRLGGPAVGLSADMPSFETLSTEQVRALVQLLRSFCSEPGWPHGNLNLPRALYTRKAFPENDVVIQPVASHSRRAYTEVGMSATVERRFGRRLSAEIELPLYSVGLSDGRVTGIGDLTLGSKYVLTARAQWPLIVTAGATLSTPTGNRKYGFGEGTRVLWPYVSAGTLRGRVYVQADVGAQIHLPRVDFDPVKIAVFNAAVAWDVSDSPLTWTLGVEVNGVDGGLGVVPVVRKGLTRSGTLSAALGVRLPIRPHYPFKYDSYRWKGYLLWEPLPKPARR